MSPFEFHSGFEKKTWLLLAALFVPASLFLRVFYLNNSLMDFHQVRQVFTALTIYYFNKGTIDFWNYQSPHNGAFWRNVWEFPLYQWICAQLLGFGLSVEVTSRLVTLGFFFLGFVVAVAMVARLIGKREALWTALFYLVSRFMVFNSRTVLVDTMAVFFTVTYVWLALEYLRGAKKESALLIGVFLFCALGGLSKATVWIAPNICLGAYWIYLVCKRRELWPRLGKLAISVGCAGIVVFAWIRWTNYLLNSQGVTASGDWIFGTLAQRFDPSEWELILNVVFRNLLDDWMVVPFVGALFLSRGAALRYAWAGVALWLVSTLITFNTHAHHDYYLLGEAPYLLAVVGIGASTIFERLSSKKLLICLGISALLLLNSVRRAPANYQAIYSSFWGGTNEAFSLKSLTSEQDIIGYPNESSNLIHLTFYSERLVALMPQGILSTEWDSYQFDVLNIKPGFEEQYLGSPYVNRSPSVWVDTDGSGFYVYRLKPKNGFSLDPTKHVATTNVDTSVVQATLDGPQSLRVSSCANRASTVFALKNVNYVRVSPRGQPYSFVLPSRKFLSLPARSYPWGCQFDVVTW